MTLTVRDRHGKSPKRRRWMLDRLIFAGLYGLVPTVLSALAIVKPETVIKWHAPGSIVLRWKSRPVVAYQL